MPRPLLLTIIILPSLVSAQVFRTVTPLGLDLLQQKEVPLGQADVVVSAKTIEAPSGVRCGKGPYEPRVVTTLERECEVRLESGAVRSIWVTFEADCLVITLRPADGGLPGLAGEFTSRWVKVDGLETRANFGTLRMSEDGHYSLGLAQGRWKKVGPSIEFDGPVAHWQTTLLKGGDLKFTFLRGPLEYTILYARTASSDQRAER